MTVPMLSYPEQQKRDAMAQRVCLYDDMPCTCDQGRPCMMTDHDIDLPGPMPLNLVFTQRVQMILAVVCLAIMALAAVLTVQQAREIDRQLAMEARV